MSSEKRLGKTITFISSEKYPAKTTTYMSISRTDPPMPVTRGKRKAGGKTIISDTLVN